MPGSTLNECSLQCSNPGLPAANPCVLTAEEKAASPLYRLQSCVARWAEEAFRPEVKVQNDGPPVAFPVARQVDLECMIRPNYLQPGNLKLPIRVLQLNVPLAFRYSVV